VNRVNSDFTGLLFDSGGLSASYFHVVSASEYSGVMTDLTGSGIIYASDSGSSQGKLYYDPDVSTAGDEVLLATITESHLGSEGDYNLVATDIQSAVEPDAVPV